MTAAEWLVCTDPHKMLAFLREKASDRRLRLFACACCRQMWHLLTDRRSRRAVEIAERSEEGEADDEELRLAMNGAENAAESLYASAGTPAQDAGVSAAFAALMATSRSEDAAEVVASQAASAAYHAATAAGAPSAAAVRDAQRARQADLLRDSIGNPFHRMSLSPAVRVWNDAVIVRLAQAAYDNRILPAGTLDNARLAVLADALEEAGCTDEQLLTHLRSGGEHYRGCFVVDLLLGKS